MNVLLVTDCYPPEIRSISFMMRELAEGLVSRGHNVAVITAMPRYNLTEGVRQDEFEGLSFERGVKVVRVNTLPIHKVGFVVRGLAHLVLPYLFFGKSLQHIRDRVDTVLVYSPPLTLSLVGTWTKKYYGARYILNVQDIFPQNAIDLRIMRSKTLIRIFEWMESMAYRNASRVTAHSERNMDFLVTRKGISPEKISVVHNWIDLAPYINVKNTGESRKKYGLTGKFVFIFPGILGPSQGLELVIETAREVKENPEICFLFLGDGSEKERLQKMAAEYELANVVFEGFVSKEECIALMKESDVGLACLSSKNKTPVYPGKILAFMACSLPVAAFLHAESDGHRFISDAECGYSIVSNDPRSAVKLIRKIYSEKHRLSEYGRNGLRYVTANFAKDVCIDKLCSLMSRNIF